MEGWATTGWGMKDEMGKEGFSGFKGLKDMTLVVEGGMVVIELAVVGICRAGFGFVETGDEEKGLVKETEVVNCTVVLGEDWFEDNLLNEAVKDIEFDCSGDGKWVGKAFGMDKGKGFEF